MAQFRGNRLNEGEERQGQAEAARGDAMNSSDVNQWFVVRTNTRCERRACRSLRSAGYRVYWPKMRKGVIHHRTKRKIFKRIGLLAGYVFVRMTRLSGDGFPDWWTLRRCDGVKCVLGIDGRPLAIPRDDVARFMRWQRRRKFDDEHLERIARKQRRDAFRKKYREGIVVRVVDGPFGGLVAEVKRATDKDTVSALVDVLGRLTPVEFDAEQLEIIDKLAEVA